MVSPPPCRGQHRPPVLALSTVVAVLALLSPPLAWSRGLYAVTTPGLGLDYTCLGGSPRDPNFVMVGTSEGRILRTLDGGATWDLITVTPVRSLFWGRERQPIPSLEYAPGLPGKSPHMQSWIRRQGLHTSGINMAQLLYKKGDKSVVITWIEVDAQNENVVFLGTMNGLYRSGDKGRSFVRVFQGIASNEERVVNTVAVDPFNSRRVLIGTAGGLFKSEDGGLSFRKETNYYIMGSYIRELWFDPQQQGLLHMAMAGSAMASPDGGVHWITTHWDEWGPRADVVSLSLGPQNLRLIGTRDGVFASWQGGEMGTWRRRGYRFIGHTMTKVLATEDPTVWLALTDDGVWATGDSGLNWRKIHQTGGKESPRWIRALGGSLGNLWLLTNRQIYRVGPPERASRRSSQRASAALLDVPSLHDLVVRILKHNRMYFPDNQRYRERNDWIAFVPTVTAGYTYAPGGDAMNLRTFQFYDYPYHYTNNIFDKGNNWEVMANWNLSNLIFNKASLPHWGRVERNLSAIRQDLSDKAHRLYLEYMKTARTLIQAPPADPLTRQMHEIRLQEITAYFDALSGGYWSKTTGGIP